MPRSRAGLVLAAALVIGCGDAAGPNRMAGYPFDLSGTGLVFHWPTDRLPVRYWLSPDAAALGDLSRAGVQVWAEQFLYGEYRGVLVDDSTGADVRIRVRPANPPSVSPTDDPPVPNACSGVTSNDYTTDGVLTGPFEILLVWDPRFPDTDVVNCLKRVTAHEIGHTIGLFTHSPGEQDLMNATPRVAVPSPADRTTAETLYHTPATLRPAIRPQ